MKKIKVFITIPNLSAGGAEKVMTFLAKNINRKKFETTLIVIGKQENSAYDTTDINIKYLGNLHVRNSIFPLIKLIRKEKPNIVLGSISHLNTILGLISFIFKKTAFIGRETIVSSVQDEFYNKTSLKSKLFSIITKIGYKGLNYFISQSEDMKAEMINVKGIPNYKITTINNPASDNFQAKLKIPPYNDCFKLITVGRLVKQKGHARILEVLSNFKQPFIYTIIGDGEEKEYILKLAEELNIIDKIKHIPFTKNVNNYLSDSHLYLQGSYVEGFPNALIESLAVGTPAIVYAAPGGINEIMKKYENGFIATNKIEFREYMLEVLENIENYQPSKVSQWVTNAYNSQKIIQNYEDFFTKVS